MTPAIALLCCPLLGAPGVAWADQDQEGCVRLEVSAEVDGPKAHEFSASATDDLHFRILFRKKKVFDPGETLRLDIFLPEGHLYQSLTLPMPASGDGSERPVVTAPAFPVAATEITGHSLYGRWLVEAWPEGSQRPCRARFRIVP